MNYPSHEETRNNQAFASRHYAACLDGAVEDVTSGAVSIEFAAYDWGVTVEAIRTEIAARKLAIRGHDYDCCNREAGGDF